MAARSFLSAYVIVGVLNVIAEVTGNTDAVQITKPLLMPVLLGFLIAVAWGFWVAPLRWLAAGLVFAWAGDLALLGEGDTWFMLGIAAFLIMQACYLVAFLAVKGPGLVRAWKITLIPYVLVWLAINAMVWSGAGDLRIPVLLYSAVAVAMAAAALDLVLRLPRALAWQVAGGAGLFVISDALIALTAFGPLAATNGTSAAVMATYIAAQGFIVTAFAIGTLRVLAPEAPAAQRPTKLAEDRSR